MDEYLRYEAIRVKRGVTDTQVSEATGIPRSMFTDWKKGRYVPKVDKIARVADFLRCAVSDIRTSADTDFWVIGYDLKLNQEERSLVEFYREERKDGLLHTYFKAMKGMTDAILKK